MANDCTLYGDGIHDDTAAIQERLDSGAHTIYLPPPKAHYLISRTLRIHSDQALVLDRFTVIKLAPRSDCLMLANADQEKGNRNIAMIGGVWDMDNVRQSPNPIMTQLEQGPNTYQPDRYLGVCVRFLNVDNLTMRSLTFRDPVTFCTQLARLRHFTVEDILFDYQHFNPIAANMDGIHLDGDCRFGRIANLKGATNDDLVAINADDNEVESPCFGPIEDVTIDGIYAEHCHSAVRLLSSGSAVRRITIRNVHGTFYRYAVGFTKFFFRRPGTGHFDSIVLENLHCGKSESMPEDRRKEIKPDMPLVYVERDTHVRRLAIRDFHRQETDFPNPAVVVQRGAKVDSLLLDHCSSVNETGQPLHFVLNQGSIGSLVVRDFIGRSPAGGSVIMNDGVLRSADVRGLNLEGMDRGIYAALPEMLRDAEGVTDAPVPSAQLSKKAGAALVEDEEAETGRAIEITGQKDPFPVAMRSDSAEVGAMPYPRPDVADGRYAWYALGGRDLFYWKDALRLEIGSGEAAVVYTSPRLPAGQYRPWVRLKSTKQANGTWTIRLARVLLEPVSTWQTGDLLVDVKQGWHFRTDPQDQGAAEQWQLKPVDGNWKPIDITRRWTDQGFAYHGVAWYAADVPVPARLPAGKRVWLAFQAVDGSAEVWLDGQLVGVQRDIEGMWDKPWGLDVTEHLKPGKSMHLVLRVFKERYDAGIYKPVQLRAAEPMR